MTPPFPGMDPYLEQPTMWADVHNSLMTELRKQINTQLSPHYVAVITTYVAYETLDIAATSAHAVPDVAVLRRDVPAAVPPATTTTPATATAPAPVTALVDFPTRYATIEIRAVGNDELVTVIELLSPANKRPGYAHTGAYLAKRNAILASPVHLLELDLLRRGERPPLNTPVPAATYYITLSRAEQRPTVLVWAVGVQQPLPVVPVPLRAPDPDVQLDIQTALQTVYADAGYARRIDYRADPPPPALSPEDAAWLAAHLRAAGVRA